MTSTSVRDDGRRVQRVPEAWPLLHLETTIPEWTGVVVDGLVRRRRRYDREALHDLGTVERPVPVHCVWGWSRPDGRWTAVAVADLLDAATPLGAWVTVRSAAGGYSSSLPIADAARGLLAWKRDGRDLTPEEGGPVRFLAPPDYWAYKGVKWAARITVVDRFLLGLWESKVADPLGRIPDDVELPCVP